MFEFYFIFLKTKLPICSLQSPYTDSWSDLIVSLLLNCSGRSDEEKKHAEISGKEISSALLLFKDKEFRMPNLLNTQTLLPCHRKSETD